MSEQNTALPKMHGQFLTYIQDVKETQVALWKQDMSPTDDIPPCVRVIREGGTHKVEVIAWAPQINRDMGLKIAEVLSEAIQPDLVYFVADAHVTKSMTNPNTGEQWGPGEMQNLCDNEGACAVGLLDDCMAVTTVWRDGRVRMESLIYQVDKDAGTVKWFTPIDPEKEHLGKAFDTASEGDDKGEARGFIPEVLKSCFEPSELFEVMRQAGDALGLSELEQEARMLNAACGMLLANHVKIAILTDNEEAKSFYETIQSTYAPGADHIAETMDDATKSALEVVEAEIARRKAERQAADA